MLVQTLQGSLQAEVKAEPLRFSFTTASHSSFVFQVYTCTCATVCAIHNYACTFLVIVLSSAHCREGVHALLSLCCLATEPLCLQAPSEASKTGWVSSINSILASQSQMMRGG